MAVTRLLGDRRCGRTGGRPAAAAVAAARTRLRRQVQAVAAAGGDRRSRAVRRARRCALAVVGGGGRRRCHRGNRIGPQRLRLGAFLLAHRPWRYRIWRLGLAASGLRRQAWLIGLLARPSPVGLGGLGLFAASTLAVLSSSLGLVGLRLFARPAALAVLCLPPALLSVAACTGVWPSSGLAPSGAGRAAAWRRGRDVRRPAA